MPGLLPSIETNAFTPRLCETFIPYPQLSTISRHVFSLFNRGFQRSLFENFSATLFIASTKDLKLGLHCLPLSKPISLKQIPHFWRTQRRTLHLKRLLLVDFLVLFFALFISHYQCQLLYPHRTMLLGLQQDLDPALRA